MWRISTLTPKKTVEWPLIERRKKGYDADLVLHRRAHAHVHRQTSSSSLPLLTPSKSSFAPPSLWKVDVLGSENSKVQEELWSKANFACVLPPTTTTTTTTGRIDAAVGFKSPVKAPSLGRCSLRFSGGERRQMCVWKGKDAPLAPGEAGGRTSSVRLPGWRCCFFIYYYYYYFIWVWS